MLLQSDSDSTLGEHIDRYDPLNRVYLGSFQIFGAATAIAASSTRGLAFVRSGTSNVDIFNYSTGDYIRSSSLSGTSLALNTAQDKLYSISGGTVTVLDLNTYLTSTITLSGQANTNALYISDSGRILIADDATLSIRCFTSTGSLTSTVTYSGYSSVKQIAERRSSSVTTLNRYHLATNATTSLPGFNETISTGNLSGLTTTIAGFNSVTGVVDAHEGLYVTGVRTSTPTLLSSTRVNSLGSFAAPYSLSQTTSLTGQSAIVLAPEPGAFVALGLGILPLLIRRKKK